MGRDLCKLKKDSSGLWTVKYQITDGDQEPDTVMMEIHEQPTKDLLDALQAMAEHALEFCEFPKTWKLTVLGVTITHTNDVQGLVITCTRALKKCNAPLIVNTPHFTRDPYNEEDESGMGIFSDACCEALDRLETLAFAFIDGDRVQKQLEFEKQPALAVG